MKRKSKDRKKWKKLQIEPLDFNDCGANLYKLVI